MIAYLISLLWGIGIGLAVAIPVGPIGLICIQRTLAKNKLAGIIAGIGAATADALLASVAAFSFKLIFSFITEYELPLRIVGAIILLVIGIISLKTNKKIEIKVNTAIGHIEGFISGLMITITNPLTAFIFFATFAGINKKVGHDIDIATIFVIGVFLGSCIWWFALTYITDRIAYRINEENIATLNRWFSYIIISVSIFILISVLFKYVDII
jgi:threonine/homoserine/homoserine lactone efflux protein